jgi:hypothetical protein
VIEAARFVRAVEGNACHRADLFSAIALPVSDVSAWEGKLRETAGAVN